MVRLGCAVVAMGLVACRQLFGIDSTQLADTRSDDAARDAALDGKLDASDGPAVACTSNGLPCPAGGTLMAITCNGACWAACTATSAMVKQVNAAGACTTWGGKLAALRSAADQACVASTLFPGNANWIGLEQTTGSNQVGVGWTWNNDGVTITYTQWAAGQPNDGDGSENGVEQVAYMDATGGWQDTTSSTMLARYSCVK